MHLSKPQQQRNLEGEIYVVGIMAMLENNHDGIQSLLAKWPGNL